MEISKNWRLQHERYGLIGSVCPQCGEKSFPARVVCPKCSNKKSVPLPYSGKGKIFSFTTVYDAPEGFEGNGPYTVAHVKLDEGPIVTAQITDVERDKHPKNISTGLGIMMHGIFVGLGIDTPVEMVTRKLREDGDKGVLVYSYKFRPDETAILRQHREARLARQEKQAAAEVFAFSAAARESSLAL